MYLRFIVSYFDEEYNEAGTGIFRSADYVRDNYALTKEERARLEYLIKWFDNNLPIPDFYKDPATRNESKRTFF